MSGHRDPWDEYASAVYWQDRKNAPGAARRALDTLRGILPGDPFGDTQDQGSEDREPPRSRTVVRAAVLALLLVVAFLGGAATALHSSPPAFGGAWPELTMTGQAQHASGLKPCATEDSSGCYWDAKRMGNGQGHSFTAKSSEGR
jgi:hypothetical protein